MIEQEETYTFVFKPDKTPTLEFNFGDLIGVVDLEQASEAAWLLHVLHTIVDDVLGVENDDVDPN